ncbi:unnamed protein product [Gadus morhua 'NCC']
MGTSCWLRSPRRCAATPSNNLPDTGRNTSLPEGLCGAHSSTLGPLALHWGQTPPCMEALSDGRAQALGNVAIHTPRPPLLRVPWPYRTPHSQVYNRIVSKDSGDTPDRLCK